jgi:CheY-like chemotaxis protein
VDDDKRRMQSYVQELQFFDYNVNFKADVDEALDFFENNHEQLELVILDIMMPTGNSFSNDRSDNGLRTGICFYERIRSQKQNLPVIILTNISSTELLEIKLTETLICEKTLTIPFQFAEIVRDFLQSKN